jgi:hypothetical protein
VQNDVEASWAVKVNSREIIGTSKIVDIQKPNIRDSAGQTKVGSRNFILITLIPGAYYKNNGNCKMDIY